MSLHVVERDTTRFYRSVLRDAIEKGAPLYNQGKKKECFELYLAVAKTLIIKDSNNHQSSKIDALLSHGVKQAEEKATIMAHQPRYDQAAWILRRCFDQILLLATGDTFTNATEQVQGKDLAEFAELVERTIEISDRKYHLKTYKSCFVGQEAVNQLVVAKLASSREDATKKMDGLLRVGLIHHVTRSHTSFKDEYLFYRFSSLMDLRDALHTFRSLPVSAQEEGSDNLVSYAAILNRYKQYHKHPSLGVIRLDYDYPPSPGDIDHPDSYEYPVYYRVVPGLSFEMCQSGKMPPAVEKEFDEAILWLANHKDVSAITGDCGFMMWFIERARKLCTKKPILLSPLMQLPSMAAACSQQDKILILTANGHSLEPMYDLIKRQCGIDSRDLNFVFVGCEDVPFFGEPVAKGLQVDTEKAMPGIIAKVKDCLQEHADTRMILMECTELPPYSDAVREATRLPVFDAITNCDFIMNSFLDNKSFGLNGWYEEWDGAQEKYELGQNLRASQKLRCVWCKQRIGNE